MFARRWWLASLALGLSLASSAPLRAADDDVNPFAEIEVGDQVTYAVAAEVVMAGKTFTGSGAIAYGATEKTEKAITFIVALSIELDDVEGDEGAIEATETVVIPLDKPFAMDRLFDLLAAHGAGVEVEGREIGEPKPAVIDVPGLDLEDVQGITLSAKWTATQDDVRQAVTATLEMAEDVPMLNVGSFEIVARVGDGASTKITATLADFGHADDEEEDEDEE